MQYIFKTSKGELLSSDNQQLIEACEKVARQYEKLALATRNGDSYAAHVTEAQKHLNLNRAYMWAEQIRKRGNLNNFTVWQKVNYELTGECPALLT